uniref:NADH dehydrogenase subunit 4L n=1 Tax=Ruizia karukerae TaxID=2201929 RepID=A0A343YNA3_9BILA|nr:NADH dehydrogenase subunit 4L [Ruizia karukerae]
MKYNWLIMFLFISSFFLFFKWGRLIFILIGLEFLTMSLFIMLSYELSGNMFLYFMCFAVVSSLLGLVIIINNMSFYGSESTIF